MSLETVLRYKMLFRPQLERLAGDFPRQAWLYARFLCHDAAADRSCASIQPGEQWAGNLRSSCI